VPEDISIVGFDDIELSQFAQPPLTTIRLPRTELGRIAFDALFRILRGDSHKGTEYRIETHLVVRSSTSAARSLQGSRNTESAAIERG
jgi:DNA-binding LacI/PurR family transcriptional regulator